MVPPEPGTYSALSKVRLRDGATASKVAFGELGYVKAAKESWAIFQKLTAEGTIAPETRFQVCLPTPVAVVGVFLAEYQDEIERSYESRLLTELNEVLDFIPKDKLAIQLDVSWEFALLEGLAPSWFGSTYEEQLPRVVERLARFANAVPDGVEFGVHLCYGDASHKHFKEPKDMTKLADVATGLISLLHRPLTYLHLPVPRSRDDVEYFAPLQSVIPLLASHQTQLFLGLIHLTDGEAGAKKRIDAATKVVKGFGVSTECGFGRRPEEHVIKLLSLMQTVSNLVPQ
ncbi:unnamed protein product [Rotaria sp. Silwood2]|nr:unnamed protein product [Rotaria sp. Silwood2]CAF3366999.1 unnamed protein product [Rotaria sp. Silwood2]CAF4235480.1 unnamed protein product [Rotaria sp. Silwood2]CAF4260467.1 unnamed protein product [Rotaria sp. Silwood2]